MMPVVTSEQVQAWIRIVIYWLAGMATTYGVLNSNNYAIAVSVASTVANAAWTLYGNRVLAKINELAKLGEVKQIVVVNPAVAKSAPSDKVVS